jgi:hypothetical protein
MSGASEIWRGSRLAEERVGWIALIDQWYRGTGLAVKKKKKKSLNPILAS